VTKYNFVIEWFSKRPMQKFTNAELERNLRNGYEAEFGGEFRDPLREARKGHERGILQRTPKGAGQVYWFDPKLVK